MDGTVLLVIFVIIVAVVAFLLWANNAHEDYMKKKQQVKDNLSNLKDFTFTQSIIGEQSLYAFAVDNDSQKIAYVTLKDSKIINYKDIIGVELLQDNDIILSKSLGRTVGGALIGGAIAGEAGSIIGGLSGDQKVEKSVSQIKVKVLLRNITYPSLEILCFNAQNFNMKAVRGENSYFKPAMKEAERITDIIKVIIDKTESKKQEETIHKVKNVSIADELEKLTILRDTGVLTEAEFIDQKEKLLKS